MSKRTKKHSVKHLLEGVRLKEEDAKALLYLFLKDKSYTTVERYIVNRGGSPEDVQDIFHDAIVVLVEAIEKEKFKPNNFSLRGLDDQLAAYLMSISKNLWKKELRWRNRDGFTPEEQVEDNLRLDLLSGLVAEAFEEIGPDCKTILSLYFIEHLSPRVIAPRIGSTTEAVKSQLGTCIDKLLKDIGHLLGTEQRGMLLDVMNASIEDLEERCGKILSLFYFQKNSMTEIAKHLGYANAHTVTEQKRRCMIRLNQAVVARLLNNKKP